jgi:hypothetical protein
MVLGYFSAIYFGPDILIPLVTAAIVSVIAKKRMSEPKKLWINAISLQTGNFNIAACCDDNDQKICDSCDRHSLSYIGGNSMALL